MTPEIPGTIGVTIDRSAVVAATVAHLCAFNRMRSEVWLIGPELAKHILQIHNKNNRNLSTDRAETYGNDMKGGRFYFTGSGLTFDLVGNLLDGQHRLEAIVRSGMAVELSVSFGAETQAGLNIDVLRVRRPAENIARARGVPPTTMNKIAGYVRVIETLLTKQMRTMTSAQILERYAFFKEEIDWALATFKGHRGFSVAPIIGALVFAFRKNPEGIDDFATRLIQAEGLKKGEPVHTFHQFYTAGGKYSQRSIGLRVLRAAQAHCDGEELRMLNRESEAPLAYFAHAYDMAAVPVMHALVESLREAKATAPVLAKQAELPSVPKEAKPAPTPVVEKTSPPQGSPKKLVIEGQVAVQPIRRTKTQVEERSKGPVISDVELIRQNLAKNPNFRVTGTGR